MSNDTEPTGAGLDYEVVPVCDMWQVWTPGYPSGACIGSGKTKIKAMEDAIQNMKQTCRNLVAEL